MSLKNPFSYMVYKIVKTGMFEVMGLYTLCVVVPSMFTRGSQFIRKCRFE